MTLNTDIAKASQDASDLAERLLKISQAIAPLPESIWQVLAQEFNPFTVQGTQTVRYGKGDRWLTRQVTGKGEATNEFFGGDPLPGVTKEAQLLIQPGTILPKAKGATPPPVAPEKPVINIGPMWKPPLAITKGGVYEGMWKSDDPTVPAVDIQTTERVEIRGEAEGAGHIITARWVWANLILRRLQARGHNPNVEGRLGGRFLHAEGVESLLIEDVDLFGSAGTYVNTWRQGQKKPYTIIMQRFRGKNIEGRYSNGKGGHLERFYRTQFVQLNNLKNIHGALLDLLRCDNAAGESRPEDVINFAGSTGTPESFITVQRTLIHGAHGWPVNQDYTGGGIMLCDGVTSAYQQALDCVVLEASNYGLAVASGNHARVKRNLGLGTGQLADGTILDSTPDAGYYARLYGDRPQIRDPRTVVFQDNRAGWVRRAPGFDPWRSDFNLPPEMATSINNRSIEGDVTPAMLTQAIANWEAMASRAGMKHVGSL